MNPAAEVSQLARKLGIRVKRFHIIQKGVYRVTTTRGKVYCLKRMAYPPAQLRWIDLTLGRIKRRGFRQIAWRVRGGKRLYVRGNYFDAPPFVLIPWLNGRYPSPHSKAHMRASGALLARFHRAANQAGVRRGKGHLRRSWITLFRRDQKAVRLALRKARRHGYSNRRFNRLLNTHGREILRMTRSAVRHIHSSNYSRLARTRKLSLIHGDCGPTNILLTKKGAFLIDFETMRMDLRAYDLYRLIFNSCNSSGWRFATARHILDGYQKITPLHRADYQMLKVLLRFPRSICKHIVHYEQKDPVEKRRIVREFPKVLSYERRMNTFLHKLDRYAKRR